MRKLVTIRVVKEILPIDGADRIELAKFDGWQCIVPKGQFKPDDAGVFCEIDSILPSADPRFAFMESKKFRVKTMKMKKVLSQGLLLPTSQFTPEELSNLDLIGVTLYEAPIPGAGKGEQKGNFPSFIPKTDQERIQNIPNILKEVKLFECEITEKLDGTSFTAWFRDGEVGIASRNWEVKTDVPGWYSTAFHDNSLDGKLRAMGRNIAIQGEIIGPSIQGNKYKLDALKMFVFDIYDIDMKRYVSASERTELCTRLGLTHVPVIPYTLLNLQENPTVDDVLKAADGNSSLAMTPREGLVFKGDARFKAISNLWLLANE